MNASLQLFWAIPSIRFHFSQSMKEYANNGPVQYKDLITAVIEFFGKIDQNSELKVYCSDDIRRELFKLYYVDDIFDLYSKADPCEAIDKILTVVHHWISASQSPCKCFIHEKFFLNRTIESKCSCGESTMQNNSENMFAEIFVTD